MVELLGLIFGSNSIVALIVGFATIKYERSKSRSEAKGAEAEADMKRQDYYQEMIEDINKDRERMKELRDEQEKYIAEIRADRHQLREEKEQLRRENEDLRKDIAELQKTQRAQGDKIAYLERLVEAFKPLICSNVGCNTRQGDILGLVDDNSFNAVVSAKRNGAKEV